MPVSDHSNQLPARQQWPNVRIEVPSGDNQGNVSMDGARGQPWGRPLTPNALSSFSQGIAVPQLQRRPASTPPLVINDSIAPWNSMYTPPSSYGQDIVMNGGGESPSGRALLGVPGPTYPGSYQNGPNMQSWQRQVQEYGYSSFLQANGDVGSDFGSEGNRAVDSDPANMFHMELPSGQESPARAPSPSPVSASAGWGRTLNNGFGGDASRQATIMPATAANMHDTAPGPGQQAFMFNPYQASAPEGLRHSAFSPSTPSDSAMNSGLPDSHNHTPATPLSATAPADTSQVKNGAIGRKRSDRRKEIPEGLSEEAKAKLQKKREGDRIAQETYRNRQQERIAVLEEQLMRVNVENAELKAQVQKLEGKLEGKDEMLQKIMKTFVPQGAMGLAE